MEVYGVKPKIFTKDWWPYFWEYYKLHTFAVLIVAFFIISTLHECKNQIKYDLQIDVITENTVPQKALDALSDAAQKNISDVTENGKNEAYVNYLYVDESGDPQYFEAINTKMMVETGYTDAFIFLVSKKYADYMSELGVFKPASEWTDRPSYNGFCISLENCEILKNQGFDTSDLYLGIVELREREKAKERENHRPMQENGISFAKFLLNEE